MNQTDTIVAPATGEGGAIAVVRMSGENSFAICDSVFRSSMSTVAQAAGYTIIYGNVVDGQEVVDDVLVSVFRAPHSYTGQDSVEISCHASPYIVSRIVALLVGRGARVADRGEFTMRAFMAGKIDLSQAEAVADVIAADSRSALAVARTQMRGGYTDDLHSLRDELLRLASLMELELDFGEEDVEFADREKIVSTVGALRGRIATLTNSFAAGNAIKHGVQVAIVGRPNAGKSTLLNRLVGEQRALVSDIAGTTRDAIEVTTVIDDVKFRFIDTAGLHKSDDRLEQLGMERTRQAIDKAAVVLQVIDASDAESADSFSPVVTQRNEGQHYIYVFNKIDNLEPAADRLADRLAGDQLSDRLADRLAGDQLSDRRGEDDRLSDRFVADAENDCGVAEALINNFVGRMGLVEGSECVAVSAKTGFGFDLLRKRLRSVVDTTAVYGGAAVVSTMRHYEAFCRADEALSRVEEGIAKGLPTDLVAQDLRESLHHIGTITGQITTTEILEQIFSRFCIGK